MDREQVKIFIVEDSKVARELLIHIFEKDPLLKVIGFAVDGEDALEQLKHLSPDVITMDVLLPTANGFEVTRKIMETKPVPIVIISAAYSSTDTAQAFKAIEAGALAIFAKPVGALGGSKEIQEIVNTIKMVSEVKVVKRRFLPPKQLGPPPTIKEPKERKEKVEVVAIGASLGGPVALATILAGLPASFPLPILIVQHISKGFTKGLANWLQIETALKVSLAEDGEKVLPGHVYIAPDNCHMGLKKGNIIHLDYTPAEGLQPSASYLFRSVAQTCGPRAVGVILTGMGRDGAAELLLMRQKGAYTIGQEKNSCIMYGMPKEAFEIGALTRVLTLEQISAELIDLAGSGLQ